MKITPVNQLNDLIKQELFLLWNNEYPNRLSYSNLSQFEAYLSHLKNVSHLILLDEGGNTKGWYFDFIRENEPWFGMILDRSLQRKGWGTRLLQKAKEKHSTLNGWVIDHENDVKQDGSIYPSPLPFYLKNGFQIMASERLELDHISAVKIQWRKERNS